MSIASCMLDKNYWMKVCSKISTLSLSDRDIWGMCSTVNTKKPAYEQRGRVLNVLNVLLLHSRCYSTPPVTWQRSWVAVASAARFHETVSRIRGFADSHFANICGRTLK